MMGQIPAETKKIAHLLYQHMSNEYRKFGDSIPAKIRENLAILEKIAYLELGGIHSPEDHPGAVIAPVNISLPEAENSPKNRELKDKLESASFKIDMKKAIKMIGKNEKLIAMILRKFNENKE